MIKKEAQQRGYAVMESYNAMVDSNCPQDVLADVLHALLDQYGVSKTHDYWRLAAIHVQAETGVDITDGKKNIADADIIAALQLQSQTKGS